MGQTLVAYAKNIDSAVLLNLAAVPDDHVNVQGDNVRVPSQMRNLAGVYAGGVSITQSRILSPSLRDFLNLDVSPLNLGAEPLSRPAWVDLFNTPIELAIGENLRAQAAEDGAGATQVIVGVWLSDGPAEKVRGDISTVRVTGTTTLTADVWSTVPLTFDQELPSGRYQLVGMQAISASAVLARAVIPRFPWRPGVIAFDAETDVGVEMFRNGLGGVMAEFDSVQSLQLEFLARLADTTQTAYLDLIRVGDLIQ